MKKIFSILILLVFAVTIGFATTTSTSTDYRITAYKLSVNDSGVPEKIVGLKVLNNIGNEITDESTTVLSDSFRDSELIGFSWVCSGNIWGQVTLTISFGPLKHSSEDKYIYYDATLEHTESRLDNVKLGNGAIGTVVESAKVPYPSSSSSYAVVYSDSVDVPSSSIVQTSAQSETVTYNMSTNSLVYTGSSGSYGTSADKSTFNTKYENTCAYWTRYGNAKIKLHVVKNSDSTGYETYTSGTTTGTADLSAGYYSGTITITVSGS